MGNPPSTQVSFHETFQKGGVSCRLDGGRWRWPKCVRMAGKNHMWAVNQCTAVGRVFVLGDEILPIFYRDYFIMPLEGSIWTNQYYMKCHLRVLIPAQLAFFIKKGFNQSGFKGMSFEGFDYCSCAVFSLTHRIWVNYNDLFPSSSSPQNVVIVWESPQNAWNIQVWCNLPRWDRWDWYIYLHLSDFYGKYR